MKNTEVARKVVAFLIQLPDGTEITTREAIRKLYPDPLDMDDLFDVERRIFKMAKRNGLILDDSWADDMALGLPFDIPYRVRKSH